MASQRDLQKLRHIIKAIQQGNASFTSAYSFLDSLEKRMSSDDQDDVEESLRPIRKMLQSQKQSLNRLRENGESLKAALKENTIKQSPHKKLTNQQLDSEINYLTSLLKSKRGIR